MKEIGWLSPPKRIHLAPNELHVWLIDLESCSPSFQGFLSEAETTRAQKFKHAHTRHSFILVHGISRLLLGNYLKIDPQEVNFTFNEYGKPMVQGIRFNQSHTRRYALFAFSNQGQLGIDIEHMRSIHDFDNVAKYALSEKEYTQLMSMPREIQIKGFFVAWTRKEAIIKAIGKGLSIPLKSFSVEISPSQPARVLTKEFAENWLLKNLPVPPGWAAALAFDQPNLIIKKWGISQVEQLTFIDAHSG